MNYSSDVFELLFRDKIVGLPPHIMGMSLSININKNFIPVVDLVCAVTDRKGDFVTHLGEIVETQERYALVVDDGKVHAVKDGI